MGFVDLVQLLARHDAIASLAIEASFRPGLPPLEERDRPLDVLPVSRWFRAPVAVYQAHRGGLWFVPEGLNVFGFAPADAVERSRLFYFQPWRY